MKLKLFYALTLSWLFTILAVPAFSQLYYEGMVFDGLGQPLLGNNPAGVAVSPTGGHVYVTSYDASSINIYSRDDDGQLSYESSLRSDIDGVTGLNGAFAVMMSPEGNHLYVTGSLDHSVAVFSRDVVTGVLTFVEKQTSGVGDVIGISGANSLDFSPDGNFVYVTGADENAVVVFSRNVVTGELDFVQILQDENGDVNDLNYPVSVTVSDNGSNVYVASYGDNAVTVFNRDNVTGMLTFQQVLRNGVDGVTGMLGSYSVTISADGMQAYVAGLESNSIILFDRDMMGNLTYRTHYEDGVDGVDGLWGVNFLTMSPDGNYVMATGGNENALAIFSRDPMDGSLMLLNKMENGVDGVTGLVFPNNISMSVDGKSIYVTGFGSGEFVVFAFNDMNNVEFVGTETAEGEGVDGLGGASDVVVTPDGKHIYVTGDSDNSVSIFERDDNSGMMRFVAIMNGSNLEGAEALQISPDGAFVYVAGFLNDQMTVFSRDEMTGMLTEMQVMTNNVDGVAGIRGINSIVTSTDGSYVYATGFWDGTLAVFARDKDTGMLSFVESFTDGNNGIDGLRRPRSIEVSPDNNSLYIAASSDDAITWFTRDMDMGTLTFGGTYKDSDPSISFMDSPYEVVVSPDGTQVYVATNRSDALVVFDRAMDGALTYREAFVNGVDEVNGLDGANAVTMSSDGLYVYVTSNAMHAVAGFRMNVTTGSLVFETARFDGQEGVNGLNFSSAVGLSPNDRHIYVTSSGDNSLALFSCTYLVNLNQMICEGDSVVVGGSTYKNSGVYQDTFAIGSCVNIVNLDLDVQAKDIGLEVAICDGDEFEFAGQTYNSPGEYTQAYTSGMGCDSIVTLYLEVVDAFETQMIEAEICGGEKYILGSTAYDETGVYTQVTLSPFGCEEKVTLDLTVLPAYDNQITEIICEGDLFVFGTSNYTTTGTYTQVMNTSNGCDSIITLNLVVLPKDGSSEMVEQTICAGESFVFGEEEYTMTGVYTQTLGNGDCSAEITVDLTVLDAPEPNYIDAVICEGDAYMLNGYEYRATGTYENALPSVNGCDSLVVLDLTVEPSNSHQVLTLCAGETIEFGGDVINSTGNYNYVETSSNNCATTFTLNLTVLDELVGTSTVTDDEGMGNGSISVVVNGGMAPYSYEWSNGATVADLENLDAGDYTVTVTDANGCVVSYTYTVEDLTSSVRDLSDLHDIQLLPNLLAPGATSQLLIESEASAELAVRMFDNTGRQLQSFTLMAMQGQNSFELMAPAAAGLYLVNVSSEDGRTQSFRLSVQ